MLATVEEIVFPGELVILCDSVVPSGVDVLVNPEVVDSMGKLLVCSVEMVGEEKLSEELTVLDD